MVDYLLRKVLLYIRFWNQTLYSILFQAPSSDPCGNSPCQNDGLCSYDDSRDGFSCRCSRNFSGRYCEIDECAAKNCPPYSECTHQNGQTVCRCLPGYKGEYTASIIFNVWYSVSWNYTYIMSIKVEFLTNNL